MPKPPQLENVRQYFDGLAAQYSRRYSTQRPYLSYWFHERFYQALGKKNYTGKRILDVGAGNGAFYSLLQQNFSTFNYYATDLSAAMLAESTIPIEQRWVGTLHNWDRVPGQFDHIFMLGLVSYLEPDDFFDHLDWAQKHLASGGSLCISFTNRASWDYQWRRALKPLLRLVPGQGVVQQTFSIEAHQLEAITSDLSHLGWKLDQAGYIAASIPFLQHLSEAWAAKIGRWLNRRVRSEKWRRRLCPEFVLHLERV
jgi:SAM-dependent methyltransferase